MSSRLTLLFVCDEADLYSVLISAFVSAEFQLLLARSSSQAKGILMKRPVDAILIRHDANRDDRQIATQLKRVTPRIPVFLLTDQPQQRQADIECIWRADIEDMVVTQAMAMFFRTFLKPSTLSGRGQPMLGDPGLLLTLMRPQGSG